MLEIAEKKWFQNHQFKESNVSEKGSEEAEIEMAELDNPMATKVSAVEVVGELCADSEYESRTSEDPNANPNAVEVPSKPPPVGEKIISGIKYYTVTFEDPNDNEDDNIH